MQRLRLANRPLCTLMVDNCPVPCFNTIKYLYKYLIVFGRWSQRLDKKKGAPDMQHTKSTSSTESTSRKYADFASTLSFAAPPSAVFDALTSLSGLSSWWTQAHGSGQAGGELTFMFGDDSVVMRVDEAARPSTVRWTVTAISFASMQDWVGTTISFAVSPDDQGGSRLQFQHVGLTPQLECFDTCSSGWRQCLATLVSSVDRGTDQPFVSGGN